jgi:hypothetical protein
MGFRTLLFVLAVLCLTTAPVAISRGGDKEKGSLVTMTGTIIYVELEGGFYGIIADSGERYFPINLDRQYQVNGLKVRIEGKIRKNVMTTTMWGTPFEILKIERR